MDKFSQTTMGIRFFTGTMPSLIKALNRIADSFEKFSANKIEEKFDDIHIELTNVTDGIEKINTARIEEKLGDIDAELANIRYAYETNKD
jgi:hypothetical protein